MNKRRRKTNKPKREIKIPEEVKGVAKGAAGIALGPQLRAVGAGFTKAKKVIREDGPALGVMPEDVERLMEVLQKREPADAQIPHGEQDEEGVDAVAAMIERLLIPLDVIDALLVQHNLWGILDSDELTEEQGHELMVQWIEAGVRLMGSINQWEEDDPDAVEQHRHRIQEGLKQALYTTLGDGPMGAAMAKLGKAIENRDKEE